jgi:3-oxoacyl-[acyl-carrier protein] reductase
VRLVITDRQAAGLESTAATLGEAEVLARPCELTLEPQVKQLFAALMDRFGRIDVAVNCAGVMRVTPLEALEKSEWDDVLDANVGSAFLVCRECAGPMRRQGSGRIINFSSLAAHVGGLAAGPHYAAAKAAVIGLTRSVSRALAPYGVRCNAIAPAGVETEMLWMFGEEQQARLLAGIPAGRFGVAEEIAELVLWLASPAADFMTGQTLNINGGAYFG